MKNNSIPVQPRFKVPQSDVSVSKLSSFSGANVQLFLQVHKKNLHF